MERLDKALLVSIVKSYTVLGFELDDLVQEAELACVRAWETFDPSRGVLFRTYAYRCVRWHVNQVTKRKRREIKAGFFMKPIDDHVSSVDDRTWFDVLGEDATQHNAAELGEGVARMKKAIGRLPQQQRVVLRAVARGDMQADIARRLGLTRQRVQQIYAAGLETLRGRIAA